LGQHNFWLQQKKIVFVHNIVAVTKSQRKNKSFVTHKKKTTKNGTTKQFGYSKDN